MRSAKILIVILLLSATSVVAQSPPVYVVLFTHIEDNTPVGTLGTPQSRQHYMLYRGALIGMANLARNYAVPWSLQPDWKFLLAALLYEDSTIIPTTNNKNLLRYLKEDLGVVVDPHSHENYGYNYTDVAHLLDSLGVGGSTVIGGHIWDPSLPQFQEWDRFRVPINGLRYPWALWRGDILMGSGTPNHVNDPIVSGVWRPQDRYHYFVHDSAANIAAVGQFRGTIEDVRELDSLYRSGRVPPQFMLTSSYHIKPATITRAGGIAAIEDSVMRPVATLRDSGLVVPTNFTALIGTWQTAFSSRGYIFDARNPSLVEPDALSPNTSFVLYECYPNPFNPTTEIRFHLPALGRQVGQAGTADCGLVTLKIYDVLGREVVTLVNEVMQPGMYSVQWNPSGVDSNSPGRASGLYFVRLRAGEFTATKRLLLCK